MANNNLALLFPGQGSQKLGMLAELYAEHSVVKATFDLANKALGYDLWNIIQHDAVKLNQTMYTQPALLAASYAMWNLRNAKGLAKPMLLAGHSLGEYSALVCSDSLDFADALRLVQLRGELMQECSPEGFGAMAVILGLADQEIINGCNKVANGEVVAAANFNSPGQVVIAGQKTAVERAMVYFKEAGAKRALPIPVSVPSHCELMRPASEKLAKQLNSTEIKVPKIPVIHNVDVAMYTNPDDIRTALVKQLYSQVRWVETIEYMQQEGVNRFIECGPGKALTGLGKRILTGAEFMPFGLDD